MDKPLQFLYFSTWIITYLTLPAPAGSHSLKTRSSVQSAYPLFGLQEMSDLIGFFVMAHRVRMNDAG